MPNPLSDLQAILSGKMSVAGRVISMTKNGLAQIATSKGIVEVASDVGMQAGDRVMVREGKAVRIQDAAVLPTFFV